MRNQVPMPRSPSRTRPTATAEQLALPLPPARATWGGTRAGAGRPKVHGRTTVPHVRRPFHDGDHAVHVTVRARPRVGSLRRHRVAGAIGERLRLLAQADRFAARRRTFRVVHFSIQPDHLHLVVEASSARALARGLQGLLAHTARAVNRRLRRHGTLFSERYHARDLATPLEVRRAIAYVLTHSAKHPEPIPDLGTAPVDGIDPCSSARWFTGWQRPPPPDPAPPPASRPLTWLLRSGWKRHGLLRRSERPAGAR
jgi:REP element-mobilizing transposase RayT